MFNFLTAFIGSSILTTTIELCFQLILFYGIYKIGKSRSDLWQAICQRLALFFVLETLYQFLMSVNLVYFGLTFPILVKILLLGLISIPLFNLWIVLPDLIIRHKRLLIKASNKHNKNLRSIRQQELDNDPYHDVNTRLAKVLDRIDKNYAINS